MKLKPNTRKMIQTLKTVGFCETPRTLGGTKLIFCFAPENCFYKVIKTHIKLKDIRSTLREKKKNNAGMVEFFEGNADCPTNALSSSIVACLVFNASAIAAIF